MFRFYLQYKRILNTIEYIDFNSIIVSTCETINAELIIILFA